MPNINLIAARRAEKKRIEKLTRQLFMALVASVGFFVTVSSVLVTQRINLALEMAEADQRMKKIQPTLDEIARIQKETAEKQPKVDTLQMAQLSTLRWSELFQTLSQALPSDTWLTSLSAPEGEKVIVSMAGNTSSQTMAGKTQLALKEKWLFESVDIQNVVRTGTRFTFQIMAAMKPLAQPAKSAGEKDAPEGGKPNA